MSVLQAVAPGRRRADAVARALIALATLVALVPLVLVIYFLFKKGIGAINADFFTTDPTGNFFGDQGGVRSAIVGTLEIVGLAALISIPLGIGVALYLVEYGKASRFALAVRYFVDVMTGVPSIVFGLFIYITLVVSGFGGVSFAGYKGSFALALLMLPVVARSAEVVLSLVPDSLREAALALGAPRWKVTFKIVLPTALPGLITGSMLAVARGVGETAPLLFTAAVGQRPELQPRSADELAARPDLHRRHVAERPARRAGLGRGPYARRVHLRAHPRRATGTAQEPHLHDT